jgi:frataxin
MGILRRLRASQHWRLPLLQHGELVCPILIRLPVRAPPRFFSGVPAPLPEADFHRLADATLASIELRATPLEDYNLDGFDLSSSMGVLTLRLGQKGTYVLNKQTPNRQIWWSSPLSGPRRYAWSAAAGAWLNTRDGACLLRTLRDELRALVGVDLPFTQSSPEKPN